jgi:F0F1-type ATP synthase assembly protein I
MGTLINFAAFQIGWFACIMGAARGHSFWGPAVVALVLVLHFFARSRTRAAEALLTLAAGAIGFVVDTALIALGAFAPVRSLLPHPLSTVWLVALWMNFATTLNVSLQWLHGKSLLAALLGAVGGPLAYWAGDRLGAIDIDRPLLMPLLAVGLAWCTVTPVLFRLARWFTEGRLSRHAGARNQG